MKTYGASFPRLRKLPCKYDQDSTLKLHEECEKDSMVCYGDKCFTKKLDFLLKLKGEEGKVDNKIVENSLQLHAQNGSGFDTWIIL